MLFRQRNLIKSQKNIIRNFAQVSEEFNLFPRQHEGNNYDVNWSLTVDGLTPSGDAYRNARAKLLSSRLSAKAENGQVQLNSPAFTGPNKISEAGDEGFSQDAFSNVLNAQQDHLSKVGNLYIEDAGVGAHYKNRVPIRVVTDCPAAALVFRSLMVIIYN